MKQRENNRIAIYLGHPAHFHLFKFSANYLIEKGYDITFMVKRKDVLEQLVKNAGYKYIVVRDAPRTKSDKLNLIWALLKMDWRIMTFLWKCRPKVFIGSYGFWTSIFYGCPLICCNEDDANVVPRFAALAYPTANSILNPIFCNAGKWEKKVIHYPGFQKLAYLHPKRFVPSHDVIERYGIDTKNPYFLIRFAKLNAHHDGGVSGISAEIAQRLVEMLGPHGQIYITSERELEPQFEQYRLKINPLDIHHVMAFATLYIGDSQSMANEAAMLGTPSLRFNDFVGAKKIGVMEELEHVYGLTYGISSHEPEKLYAKIEELLAMANLREEFQKRRQKMLADKIDVTSFLTWFIEHYPESAKVAKGKAADDVFWKQFK